MSSRIFKDEGLVIRTRVLGEADRLVTLLTLKGGKFEAAARGARKMKSRLAAGVDIFTRGEYTFHRGKTWPIITGQYPKERFLWFREDPELYPYGLYLAELADRLIVGEEACPELYNLLLGSWRLLGKSGDRSLILRAFELKAARYLGYSPGLHNCPGCGSEQIRGFGPGEGSMVCSDCRSADFISLDSGTIALARRLLEVPLHQVVMIRPSARQKNELSRMNSAFLAYHLDPGELKSKRLLDE